MSEEVAELVAHDLGDGRHQPSVVEHLVVVALSEDVLLVQEAACSVEQVSVPKVRLHCVTEDVSDVGARSAGIST